MMGAKVGKRIFIVAGITADLYEIYSAEDKTKGIVKNAGGWAGAWGGAKLGAAIGGGGALAGGQMGPQVLAPEEIITVPVGGLIGGLFGGIGGYFVGSEVAETVYDWTFGAGIPADGNK